MSATNDAGVAYQREDLKDNTSNRIGELTQIDNDMYSVFAEDEFQAPRSWP